VDSPLASKSTTIFRENFSECYDEEALALVQAGRNPLQFPGLHISETKEESMAINGDPVPKVIISAAGMCDAGRIRHHQRCQRAGFGPVRLSAPADRHSHHQRHGGCCVRQGRHCH